MTLVDAAKQLTGTDWNLRNGKLEQADDGSPRVGTPDLVDLQALIQTDNAANVSRVALKVQARQDVRNTLLTVAQRLQALLVLLDFDR